MADRHHCRPGGQWCIVFAPYRSLVTIPGIGPFIVGAFLARVGGAMFGVAVIVMVSSRRGSYGLAGADDLARVAGQFGLSGVVNGVHMNPLSKYVICVFYTHYRHWVEETVDY